MREWFRSTRQAFWSLDALLFVLAYTAQLLVLPFTKTTLPTAGR